VGLGAVLWYEHGTRYAELWDPDVDDTQAWKEARRASLARRQPWFVLGALVFGFLLALTVSRERDWNAALLGVGAIPVLFLLAGYYHVILLGFGLLHRRHALVGPALCALSALLGIILLSWRMIDEIHSWSSLAILVFVFGVTLLLYRSARAPERQTAAVRDAAGRF
jgi:hypothetical protein